MLSTHWDQVAVKLLDKGGILLVSWGPLASLVCLNFQPWSSPILLLCRGVKTKDQRGETSCPRSHSKLEMVLVGTGLPTQDSCFPSLKESRLDLGSCLLPRPEALVQ